MYVYEMVFSKWLNEIERVFFKNNSLSAIVFFIRQMKSLIELELEEFRKDCLSKHKDDLLSLYQEVYQESTVHLDIMEKDFINTGRAEVCDVIYLEVIKRYVFKI